MNYYTDINNHITVQGLQFRDSALFKLDFSYHNSRYSAIISKGLISLKNPGNVIATHDLSTGKTSCIDDKCMDDVLAKLLAQDIPAYMRRLKDKCYAPAK